MLAMAMAALAPAVAQAVVAGAGNRDWVEVCSVSGVVWVKAAAAESEHDAGSPMADGAMNCPWCSLHGGAAGLLPQAQVASWHSTGPALLNRVNPAPIASALWRGAPARAPPHLS